MPVFPFSWDITEDRKLKYALDYKLGAIKALGGVCVVCGWTDIRALAIDHVKGDGWLERSKFSTNSIRRMICCAFHYELDEAIVLIKQRYQVLCYNHNQIKVIENGENKESAYLFDANIECINEIRTILGIVYPYLRRYNPRTPII